MCGVFAAAIPGMWKFDKLNGAGPSMGLLHHPMKSFNASNTEVNLVRFSNYSGTKTAGPHGFRMYLKTGLHWISPGLDFSFRDLEETKGRATDWACILPCLSVLQVLLPLSIFNASPQISPTGLWPRKSGHLHWIQVSSPCRYISVSPWTSV